MKKIIALTLTGAVVFSTIFQDAIPVYALDNNAKSGIEIYSDALIDDSEQTELDAVGLNVKSYEGSVVIDAASDEDADALFDGYINMLVSAEKNSEEDVAPEGVARGESLNPINRYLYDFLAEKASKVAEGSLSSTSFETGSIDLIPYYDGQYSFTKEELGVSNLNSQEAFNAALEKTGLDISKVSKALLADYPYELYWWDKVSGFSYSYAPMTNISGNKLSVESISYTFRMYVSADYSVGSGIKTTNVDTNKTGAASSTVDKAKKVVKDALDNGCTSDYKKLKFYKKYICDNTSYNYDALGKSTAFSNPWQLIYVFDEDPSTKVVCEGYSKAFKLLCDLSSFDYASLDCYLMSGLMSTTSHPTGENHMWNMVKMNDGKNYLVDVTNCDNDDGVSDDRLFLVGNASSGAAGFSISRPKLAISSTSFFPQDTVNYSYDSSTLATFTDTERKIAGANYDPATEPEPESETKVVVTLDANGGTVGTDKVTVVYGAAYGTLPTPQNEGKSFDGWFTAKSGGSKVLSTTTVTNKNAHTLYAHWTVISSDDIDIAEKTFRGEDFWVDNCGYRILTDDTVSFANGLKLKTAKVTIPSKVTYEGKEYTVTSIGGAAFSYGVTWNIIGCEENRENTWLEEVVMPDTVTQTEDKMFDFPYYYGTFANCSKLSKVKLSNSLETIGIMTFNGCSKLEIIELPDSLLAIQPNAFGGTALRRINIPAKCEWVAGIGCDTLEEINVDPNNKSWYSVDGVLYQNYWEELDTKEKHWNILFEYPQGKKDVEFTVADGTKEIGINSFYGNSYIKIINLPKSIIKRGYFEGKLLDGTPSSYGVFCDSSIEEINIDPGNDFYTAKDGILYSKDMKSLTEYPPAKKDKIYFVPGTIEKLGSFNYNEYLEELYIPSSVDCILYGAVWEMKNLKKLIFAKTSPITYLDRIAIYNHAMESLCVPMNVKKFEGLQTFFGEKLRQVYFAKGAVWDPVETKDLAGNFWHQNVVKIYGHGTDNGLPEFVEAVNKENPGIEYIDVEKTDCGLLGLTFDDTYIKIKKGDTKNVAVVEYPYHIDSVALKYETSDPNIAVVDDEGNVEAKSNGLCYITVSALDGSGEYARCQIEVVDKYESSIDSIQLSQNRITLQQGENTKVKATVLPEDADPKNVVWSSSDDAIVKVNADLTSIKDNSINVILTAGDKEGNAIITASAGDVSATVEVTVIDPVKFDKHEITLVSLPNSKDTITATVKGEGYSADNLIWSSSDEKVATVKDGIVKAAEGLTKTATTAITAETPDHKYKDTCTVTVILAGQVKAPVASVKSGEVEEGTVIELTGESSDTRILYTVDGNEPAVDIDGNPIGATILYSGGIRITKDTVIKAIAVKTGCKNSPVAEFTYTIKQSSTVSDNMINVRLVVGGKVNNAELAKSKDDGKLYKINIADNKIASVSNKGVIQGKKAGNTTATVIKKDKEYKLNITVVAAGFTKKSYTVNTGDVINPIFKSEGVEITSFVSNKPGIASVYPTTDGLYVVAKTKGSAKITAICDGKKYNVTVKVFDPYIAGTDTMLLDNKTVSLSVKNGTGKTTEWKSDNEAVLTVKNGKIKGVSKGSATITAINNGRTMEKKINVYMLPEFGQKLYETSVDKPIEVILKRDSDMGEPVYSVSNKKVATIDENGILTPVKKGNVTVTALIGGKKYSTKVKIK